MNDHHTASDGSVSTIWRCSKCCKWSHAQRRPTHHLRIIADGAPADQNGWDGTPARQVAFASGYRDADIVSEDEGPWNAEEGERAPGTVTVKCGPFDEYRAERVAS